jgi:ribosomal-protein-alanine N-acetyltransferase
MRTKMIILESERLIFRHLEHSDLDDLFALYTDPRVTQFIPDAPKNYEETLQEFEWHKFGHPSHPELGLWATIRKDTQQFIGRCGLLPWTIAGQHEVEVAYALSKANWGQGLGSEAAQAICNYGFEVLHFPRLICLIDPRNLASIKVAEKIGMSFEKEEADESGSFWIYSRRQRK